MVDNMADIYQLLSMMKMETFCKNEEYSYSFHRQYGNIEHYITYVPAYRDVYMDSRSKLDYSTSSGISGELTIKHIDLTKIIPLIRNDFTEKEFMDRWTSCWAVYGR